jgi:hypothetical protein
MNKFTPIVSSILIALASTAGADEFDSMHKQLNIMSKIITSSVAEQDGRKNTKITGVESVYLKGQGVVFTINSSSRSNSWGNHNFNFVMPDVPPVPPVAEVAKSVIYEMSNNEEFQGNINEQVSNAMEMAAESYEHAMDSLHNDRDVNRNLRDEQRDLSYQVRDLEREKRDLEYQMRRADKSSKNDMAAQVKALEKQREKIDKAWAKLTTKSNEFRKQQRVIKLEEEQERVNYYQQLTTTLVDTFCLYGNGLKSVPKNENVSLIIKSGGDKEGRRYRDSIYVFSKKDIRACAADNISAKKLLENGKGYQF